MNLGNPDKHWESGDGGNRTHATFPPNSATWRIHTGDCLTVLADLDAGSVHTVITSPPYYGLRDYGTNGQIGLEATPDQYVATLVNVFRAVRRVLRDDGTVWLNLGDSYASGGMSNPSSVSTLGGGKDRGAADYSIARSVPDGYKPKDLLGIPWLVAFALRADGWYLRADIIWHKPNPMPESVTDRPTKAHEYLFLLSKGPRYFYDADAIREPHDEPWRGQGERESATPHSHRADGDARGLNRQPVFVPAVRQYNPAGRNKRSVWTVATQPYTGAHFATFPPKLIEPCILAGAPERACAQCGAPWERVIEASKYEPEIVAVGERFVDESRSDKTRKLNGADYNNQVWRQTLGFAPSCAHQATTTAGVVLDPFAGTGTTGLVALRHNRSFTGIELSPTYAQMARDRIRDDAPLFNWAMEA